jgi:hypothetical protein
METSLNIKNIGLTADLSNWVAITGRSPHYSYHDGFLNDPIDGLQWNGSAETLINCRRFNLIQKVAPKIRFDYGSWCGHDNFEYVSIPIIYPGSYGIYALTNNKTILQLVGYLEINYNTSWRDNNSFVCWPYDAYIQELRDPDENYSPEVTQLVQSITVSGITFTYSGHGDNFQQMWVNDQLNKFVITGGNRNPGAGDECYGFVTDSDTNMESYEIDSVTYYPGVTPPSGD